MEELYYLTLLIRQNRKEYRSFDDNYLHRMHEEKENELSSFFVASLARLHDSSSDQSIRAKNVPT